MDLVERLVPSTSTTSSWKQKFPGVPHGFPVKNIKLFTSLASTETSMYFLLTNLLDFTRILNLKTPQKVNKRGKNKVIEVSLSQRVLMLPLIKKKPLES